MSPTPPTLSLIVCTYQRPDAVRTLLSAIRTQTLVPDEVLIVDASLDRRTTDAVAAERASWPNEGLAYELVPAEHRGLTRQRNYGIARATGDLIAFLDDDTVPAPDYFQQIVEGFARHPEAGGVGGYILGAAEWRRVRGTARDMLGVFRYGEWTRRDDYRWRLRRLLGLADRTPPGWMPPDGHGRPVSYIPPDDGDHVVEYIMGGASAWRREVLARHRFGEFFEGYGLYEDLDFCIRVSRAAPLVLCTRARLEHHHDPSARPQPFRYGVMVVRNGWYVWRRRWPSPALLDRVRWWATTGLLTLCRAADAVRGPRRGDALREALGRCWGIATVPLSPPVPERP